jgi:dTDP-glucose 4,6-dehydratase
MDLAEIILEITDSDSGIVHETRPAQDPEVRRPDLTKAKTELGWEPQVSLREGLKQTVPYFEKHVLDGE